MQPEPLYPVFLRLAGLPVVVVGGGPVAAGKLDGLLEAGARVTVIAPVISEAIRTRAAGNGQLALVHRGFTASDLDGARWVVAAATPEVNREVAAAATARGLFVNAVDDVASASAYLGGVIRRGPAVDPSYVGTGPGPVVSWRIPVGHRAFGSSHTGDRVRTGTPCRDRNG